MINWVAVQILFGYGAFTEALLSLVAILVIGVFILKREL